jgi:heat shock protein HslJ
MFRRPVLTAALLCLAPLSAAGARDLSGAVAIRERMALPDARLVVEVLAAGGRAGLVEERLSGQPPAPFALDVPEGPLVVRALIRAGADAWVVGPLHVPAGAEPVALGELVAVRQADGGGFASTLACGAAVVRVGFAGQEARVLRGAEVRALAPAVAASGARYAAGDTELFTKGDSALLTWGGQALPPCRAFPWPETAAVTARGNEPFWTLTAGPENVRFAPMDGAGAAAAASVTVLEEDAVRVVAPGLPDLRLTPAPCADSMTGMPYPATATLGEGETAMTGCAGDPASLLQGAWRAVEMAGAPLPEGAEVTMEFAGDRVAGRAACNRYTGGFTLSGEGLAFGPAASTKMACPEALMDAEVAFFAALARVDRFGIDPATGDLLLIGGDATLLRARPGTPD